MNMPRPGKRWSPPQGEQLKINVDGAFIAEIGGAALGVVVKDKEGQPLLMACPKLHHCSNSETAEAQACLEGVCLGSRWPDKSFILEADNASVITKLKMGGVDRSLVAPIIHDTLHEAVRARSVEFAKIGREHNRIAHELAHRALVSGECRVSFTDFPGNIITVACKDIFD